MAHRDISWPSCLKCAEVSEDKWHFVPFDKNGYKLVEAGSWTINWMVPLLLLVIHTQERVLPLLYFYINVVIYVLVYIFYYYMFYYYMFNHHPSPYFVPFSYTPSYSVLFNSSIVYCSLMEFARGCICMLLLNISHINLLSMSMLNTWMNRNVNSKNKISNCC